MAKRKLDPLPTLRNSVFPIRVVRVENHPDYPAHKHPFWEMVVVLGGTAIHHVGRTAHSIRAGDVFVLSEKDRHSYSEARNLSLCNILFDYDALRMAEWETQSIPGFQALFHLKSADVSSSASWARAHLDSIRLGQTLALIDEIEEGMSEQLPCWRMIVEGHFRHLVVLVSRVYDAHIRPHGEVSVRVAKALAFFRNHFRESINVDRVIGQVGMSRRTFYRLFKRATGQAPLVYLIHLRLQHACHLLRRTEHSITQIGFDSGFSDSNYFTREFRKVLGETPRAYRNRWSD